MNDLALVLEEFHFIRPWLLALIPVVLFLWWLVRRKRHLSTGPRVDGMAPHLAQALTVGGQRKRRFYPIDGAALVLGLSFLAAAGPTWSRVPNPLVSDTAPLVVVLKVSKSMDRTDVAPSRLERAKHKILDLLEDRSGARTALIAYAGTAHRVVPLTEDPDVIKPFLEGLSPAVMPRDGEDATRALGLAKEILEIQETAGAVLFVLDGLDTADLPAFRKNTEENGPGIIFLLASADRAELDALETVPEASVIRVTPDGADVEAVERRAAAVFREALSRDDRQAWEDRGWLFAWPAAVLMLFWFRRGWTMRWALVLVAGSLTQGGNEARADGWSDWFFTRDQQGRLAYEAKEFSEAADLFEDPMWKGYMLFRSGRYEEAAEVYAWQPSAQAAFGEGMALIRTRSYRDAITAFEKALERDADHEAARHNLELARYILDYVETTREQSDTGEESGIGADDVVYDNEAARGTDTTREYGSSSDVQPETADQWMRTVDTRSADFLRSRFALEAAQGDR
jgi:Ca-activated chloride channel family protein